MLEALCCRIFIRTRFLLIAATAYVDDSQIPLPLPLSPSADSVGVIVRIIGLLSFCSDYKLMTEKSTTSSWKT